MVLRLKITVLFAHRRVGHFREHRVEMTVGCGGFTAFAFAGTLTVARTTARPRGKVLVTGKSTHIGASFRQQGLSTTLADSRNLIKLFYRGTKRGGRYRPQPLAC